MIQRYFRALTPILLIAAAFLIAACGGVATPEWAADAQSTRVAQAATSEYMTSIAPTHTPTNTPVPTSTPIPTNTPTPVPPTATPVPPTETPVPPTATEAPTMAMDHSEGEGKQPQGDAVNGQRIFTTTYTTASGPWACSLCHTVSPDGARLIGPGLWEVSIHGAHHVEGQGAYDYIHTSIVDPQAFITPPDASGVPYPENLMPQNWEDVLTEQEIEDVITYLFTLK